MRVMIVVRRAVIQSRDEQANQRRQTHDDQQTDPGHERQRGNQHQHAVAHTGLQFEKAPRGTGTGRSQGSCTATFRAPAGAIKAAVLGASAARTRDLLPQRFARPMDPH